MNLRVDPIAVAPAEPQDDPGGVGRRPARAAVAAISTRVTAIFFDAEPARAASRARLTAELGGVTLAKPVLSTTLALRGGAERHVVFAARPAASLLDQPLELRRGPPVVARIDPSWLQSPVKEPDALIEGLAESGRIRLLRVFLATGPSLFGARDAGPFIAAATDLLDLLGAAPIPAASACRVGESRRVLSYRLPRHLASAPSELVALRGRRSARLPGNRVLLEATDKGDILHVLSGRPLSGPAEIVALGDAPLRLAEPGPDAPVKALTSWLKRRDGSVVAWVETLLAERGDADLVAAAQHREIRLGEDARADLLVRHVSGTPGGLLVVAELVDPHDLVEFVRIERGQQASDLAPRPTSAGQVSVVGFLPLLANPDRDSFRLRLVFRSGRTVVAAEGPVEPCTGEVPAAYGCCRDDLVEAVARARCAAPDMPRRIATEEFGQQPERPELSVVTAVGDNLDIVRARAATLQREPAWRSVEVIYGLHAGGLAAAALEAIRMAQAVFGVPHRAVILPSGTDRSSALFAALAAAHGEAVICLGAEVLPDAPGWLDDWQKSLVDARKPSVLAGVLLGADGSVLDAGGSVLRDAAGSVICIERHHLGLPRRDLPRDTTATDIASAECVALTRAAIDCLLGDGRLYPDPDLLLTRLIGRMRSDGNEARVAHRLICSRFGDLDAGDPIEDAIALRALDLLMPRGD